MPPKPPRPPIISQPLAADPSPPIPTQSLTTLPPFFIPLTRPIEPPPPPKPAHRPLLPPHLTPSPINDNPPVTQPIRIHRFKNARADIDVVFGAALAGVDDGGGRGGAGGRVVNVDGGAADGVVVGVGPVVHDFGGEGDDGVGVGGGVAAGAEACEGRREVSVVQGIVMGEGRG